MKKSKVLSILLTILSVMTFFITFFTFTDIAETDIYNFMLFEKTSWKMLPFAAIPLAIFIINVRLEKKGRSNLACILIPLAMLIAFVASSTTWIYSDVSLDTEEMESVEEKIGFKFSDDLKVAGRTITESGDCRFTCIKDTDKEDTLERIRAELGKWKTVIPDNLYNILPPIFEVKLYFGDYFMYYNETTGEFNTPPTQSGEYDIIVVCYDYELGCFAVLSEYTLGYDPALDRYYGYKVYDYYRPQ